MMRRKWITAIVRPSAAWGPLAMARTTASLCIRCSRSSRGERVSACWVCCIKKPGCERTLLAPLAAKRAAESEESGHGKARWGRERWSRWVRLRKERCGSMWAIATRICLPSCSAVGRWAPSSWCARRRIDGSSVSRSRPSPNWIICSTERASWPAQAHGSIEVASRHERRARTAQVQLSWAGMQLLPPKEGPYAGSDPLQLWVVRVWEPEPASKEESQREYVPSQKHGSKRRREPKSEKVEALEWILLSARPVESVEQAWQAIHHYQSRWPIEDFHRGVKTGCRLEQRHLQEQSSLENVLAIVSPIAVRLLQLRNLCREEPAQPALAWVEPEEAEVIARQQGVAVERLSIEQFVFSVAQLGGFLRRASDGPPGWQTLWDGWLRLRWFVAGMRFASHAHSDISARSP